MKVIFLDVDGVLNSQFTRERVGGGIQKGGIIGIDQKIVPIFNQLILETGACVVLSSVWRLDKGWAETLWNAGLVCSFLGRTPHLPGKIRGEEIALWLECNDTYNIEKYAIIDDDSDMLPDQPLFKTSFQGGGLNQEIAKKVKEYLC